MSLEKGGEGQLHLESRLPTNIPVFKEIGSRGERAIKPGPCSLLVQCVRRFLSLRVIWERVVKVVILKRSTPRPEGGKPGGGRNIDPKIK